MPAEPSAEADPSRPFVAYPRPWLVVLTVPMGAIAVLASSIGLINLLLPRMMAELGADIRSIQWVVTAFLLTMVVLMPAVGWLGAAVGQKRLYLIGLAFMAGATLLCTLAWNVPSMIAFRVVQGIGAGLCFPLGTPFIFDAFPPQRRGAVLGMSILIMSIGSLGGSIFAAYLADSFGWRWGFYYLFVFCVAGFISAWLVLRDRPLPAAGRFDLIGGLTLAASLVSFILLITRRDGGPFLSPYPLSLTAISLVCAVAFFAAERRASSPFVDLKIYRHAAYAAGSTLGFLIPATTVAMSFLLPIYMQRLLGYSIFQTAIIRLPMVVVTTTLTPLSGWLSDRMDPRALIGGGLVGFMGALYLLSGLSLSTSPTSLALILLIMGTASTFIFTPMSNAMFSSLPHESIRLGSGLYALKRQLGRSVGGAFISVLFAHRLALRTASLAEDIVPTSPAYRLNMAHLSAGFRDLGALHPGANAVQMLHRSLSEEAAVLAFGDCYFILAIGFVLLLLPVYFIRHTRG